MTNLELIRELKKPGKVWMPVCGKNDVHHMLVEKAELIRYLRAYRMPLDQAEWCFYGDDQDRPGDRWLDVQN